MKHSYYRVNDECNMMLYSYLFFDLSNVNVGYVAMLFLLS